MNNLITTRIATHAASLAAAALLTFGTFAANGALAGHTYRAASTAQLQAQPATVAATQFVTIVGHRPGRA